MIINRYEMLYESFKYYIVSVKVWSTFQIDKIQDEKRCKKYMQNSVFQAYFYVQQTKAKGQIFCNPLAHTSKQVNVLSEFSLFTLAIMPLKSYSPTSKSTLKVRLNECQSETLEKWAYHRNKDSIKLR